MEKQIIKKSGKYSKIAEDSSLGLSIAICICVGVYFGQLYDKANDSEPAGLLVGFLFGLGAASRVLLRVHNRLNS